MYIQYENKNGEYYCLDLFETPLDILFFSYSWIKPRKLYKSDKKYVLDISKEEASRRNRLQPLGFLIGYALSKIINLKIGFSIELNIVQSIMICCTLLLLDLACIFAVFKGKRSKMNKKIIIDKNQAVAVRFYPRTRFIKVFLKLIYPLIILYFIGFSINLLHFLNFENVYLCTVLFTFIILSPYYSFLLCNPILRGEQLKKCEL